MPQLAGEPAIIGSAFFDAISSEGLDRS